LGLTESVLSIAKIPGAIKKTFETFKDEFKEIKKTAVSLKGDIA